MVNAGHAKITRPRTLLVDEAGNLWVGETGRPRPRSAGERRDLAPTPDGRADLVLQGPLPAAGHEPGGSLFVVQRRTAQLFVLTPDGRRLEFATARNGSFFRVWRSPRSPGDPEAGIAGDLFLVVVSRSMWMINEVIRISGPFDEWARQEAGRPTP